MVESIEIRVTRMEEHVKQNKEDVAEIKEMIRTHTVAEMKSMKSMQEDLIELKSTTHAVKFGWKVLVTVGTLSLAAIGTILKYTGVISQWLN